MATTATTAMTVRAAIEAGDAAALKALLAEDASLANEVIRWGPNDKNPSVPLQYVCDMLFEGPLEHGREMPLIEALLEAGANIDHRHEMHGDTPLIAAASLLAEEVGLRLVAAGADVTLQGLFGATALHWAAMHGLVPLSEAMIAAGADVALRDTEHDSGPIGWAVHGWKEDKPGVPRSQPDVVRLLVAASAPVSQELIDFLDPKDDAPFLAALKND